MSKYFEYDVDASWRPGQVASAAKPTVPIPAPVNPKPFFAACSGQGVNIRTGRGTSNASIGKADKNAPMLALPAISDWCEVATVLNGKIVTGYMSAQYVKGV